MPLIAYAYVAFIGGLLAWYSGIPLLPALGVVGFIGAAFFRPSSIVLGSALLFTAGVLVASTSPRPARFTYSQANDQSHGLQAMFERQQKRASQSIETIFRDDAPMAKALLIADQSEVPRAIKDRYARAGIIHMLSISGLHVSIVAGAVELLLHVLRFPSRLSAVVSLVVLFSYVTIIGSPPPALRAAVMVGVVLATRLTQRPTSKWAALAIGAWIPLISPTTVLNLGYQLSVGGIAGLIASSSVMRRYKGRIPHGWRATIVRSVVSSTLATIVTAPLVAWTFGQISLVGIVANFFADPVITLVQPMLFLALVLAPVPELARYVADAAHFPLIAFDAIATWAAAIPFAAISVHPTRLVAALAGVTSVAIVVACTSRRPMRAVYVAIASVSAMVWLP